MMRKEFLEKMIELTSKKIEALSYVSSLLQNDKIEKNIEYRKWYYDQKKKVDRSILKIDMLFLDNYDACVHQKNMSQFLDSSKDELLDIENLQKLITEVKSIENQILLGEKRLMQADCQVDGDGGKKSLKQMNSSVLETYKKAKK